MIWNPVAAYRPLAVLLLLTIWGLLPAESYAQIDTDPTNDTIAGGDVLTLPVGSALTNVADLASFGGDVDFFNVSLAAGNVLLGMTTPLDNVPIDYSLPDTLVSVSDNTTRYTFSDEDNADLYVEDQEDAVSRGGLFRFRAPTANTYNVGVTAFPDYEFDGPATGEDHEDFGFYALTAGRVNPTVLGGGFSDSATNNTMEGADLISIGESGAAVAVAQLAAPGGDVDYYKLELLSGDILCAMTAPLADLNNSFDAPDTRLELYNSAGTLLVANDDAGDVAGSEADPDLASDFPYVEDPVYGSALRAFILTEGTYYLRVLQSDFQDPNSQTGRYAMLVGLLGTEEEPPAGDFNEDGSIDAADYVLWRKDFGNPYDELDYDDWAANFGALTSGSGSSTPAVPEPATALWLFAAAASLMVRTGRRR